MTISVQDIKDLSRNPLVDLVALLPALQDAVNDARYAAKDLAFGILQKDGDHTLAELAAATHLTEDCIANTFHLRDSKWDHYNGGGFKQASCMLGRYWAYTIQRTYRTTTKYYLRTVCDEDGNPCGTPVKHSYICDIAAYHITLK